MAYLISEECIACGACQAECPANCITEGETFSIDAEKCTDCGACQEICPVQCIKVLEV